MFIDFQKFEYFNDNTIIFQKYLTTSNVELSMGNLRK